MSEHLVKLPDVGEGVAEAELVSWLVGVGDLVTPESALAEVMTDKATVEISSPVTGVVSVLHGEPGDILAVGSTLITVEVEAQPHTEVKEKEGPKVDPALAELSPPFKQATSHAPTATVRTLAAPAVRARAKALGIDLATISGTGPEGRVVHGDLDAVLVSEVGGRSVRAQTSSPTPHSDRPHEEKLRGLRRVIAERLSSSWSQIPHFTYVEQIDVTDLEALRSTLNSRKETQSEHLTVLAFVVQALVLAVSEHPRMNARFDSTSQSLLLFDAVHVGVATQTDAGLMVPVIKHVETLSLREINAEISRVAQSARNHRATREELSGSTITVTSLGSLGGLVATPIINQPEVAILGVNKIETRPVWAEGMWSPRLVMNLSSSFDHRIIDGWDAAVFIQRIKELLEMPALMFAHS
jgi:2-oxoisovalerate dehydrogenase E2 component (dihydrolipoyl transacylase)